MVPEIATWIAAGLILFFTSGYALLRKDGANTIARFQTFTLLALVLALATWGISILLGGPSKEHRVVWSAGYLSVAALYAVALASRVFDDPRYILHRRLLAWLLIPFCVVVDIAAFTKVAGVL